MYLIRHRAPACEGVPKVFGAFKMYALKMPALKMPGGRLDTKAASAASPYHRRQTITRPLGLFFGSFKIRRFFISSCDLLGCHMASIWLPKVLLKSTKNKQ